MHLLCLIPVSRVGSHLFWKEAGAGRSQWTGTRLGAFCRVGLQISRASYPLTILWNLYVVWGSCTRFRLMVVGFSWPISPPLLLPPDGREMVETVRWLSQGQKQVLAWAQNKDNKQCYQPIHDSRDTFWC